ncbi:carotenoid 1,2-hydratase [Glaciecola sp. XM2]|uniref:lipocalin-like domain-containing protein n=1 Tax=Glaciecola sp. XM2 TaxID=1914931 RepID=UPI001BDE8942|nr:lipocalin-like domain-containing protein [Glaciecola sp. XM2]MBT1450213.1 carotenoid 1,2-hydratase [Glaciecola sp. XM2]
MFRLAGLLVTVVALLGCEKAPGDDEQTQTINPNFLVSQGKKADPNYVLSFPKDHLPHDAFDIEWWYLTANLSGDDGHQYALQWTLFRFAQSSQQNQWYQGQSFMGHASLHSPDQHWFSERFAPGGLGSAGVKTIDNKLNLFIDDWLWQGKSTEGTLFPSVLNTKIINNTSSMEVDITLTQTGPFVLQGENGYSIKSKQGKHASHYYSLPFIDVTGRLELPTGDVEVSGKAWFDHEWTSTLLDQTTLGWDWMSLHFDNGDKLMAFRMRLNDQEDYQTGTYIFKNGDAITLSPQQITLTIEKSYEVEGKTLPLEWQVVIPSQKVDIKVTAVKRNAYNPSVFPYYEGAVKVSGSQTGKGFLELTGY